MIAYDWSGFYIGAHLGGGWIAEERTLIPGGQFGALKYSGTLAGGQIGYNVQAGAFVLGVQGDISRLDASADARDNPITLPCNAIVACQANTKWVATATAHLGVTQGPALVYLTGGAAWLNAQYSLALTMPFEKITVSGTRAGWTLGGGLEYAFVNLGWNNLSAKIEYNYLDFGSEGQVFSHGALLASSSVRDELTMHVVKAGLNYRFGQGLVGPKY
jgi:outer membrane immunogenic protein